MLAKLAAAHFDLQSMRLMTRWRTLIVGLAVSLLILVCLLALGRNGSLTARAGGGADFALRDRINRGEIPGPRILASGAPLIRRSADSAGTDMNARIAAIRIFVRQQIAAGANVIKIFVTAGAGGGPSLLFTEEEIRAVVDEASRAHLRVAAHAHST